MPEETAVPPAPPAPPRAPSPVPALTQIQQYRCLECDSWIDPRAIEDVPHHGPHAVFGPFRRLVLMRCAACDATWVLLLQYAAASQQWGYVSPPQKLRPGEALGAELALALHESPTVRDALRRNHPALYNQVVITANTSPAAPPRCPRERRPPLFAGRKS